MAEIPRNPRETRRDGDKVETRRWKSVLRDSRGDGKKSFSVAGKTLDDRRNQLKPDTVDGLLFLHGLKH